MSWTLPCDTIDHARTNAVVQWIICNIQKLLLDLREETSLVGCMDDDEKFDATKVLGALFALITARLEDAHEIAVRGQSSKAHHELISQLTNDLEGNLEEIQILLNASALVAELRVEKS